MNVARVLILSLAVLLAPIGWATSSDSLLQSGIHLQAAADRDNVHCYNCGKDSGSAIHHHVSHGDQSHHTLATIAASQLVFETNRVVRVLWAPPEAIPARLTDIDHPPQSALPA